MCSHNYKSATTFTTGTSSCRVVRSNLDCCVCTLISDERCHVSGTLPAGNTDQVCGVTMFSGKNICIDCPCSRHWLEIHWCISRGSCTVWSHMHNYNRETNNSDITMVKGSQTVHWKRDRNGGFNERKQGTAYSHHCEPLTETCFIFVFYRPWGLPTAHMEVLLWVIHSLYMLISNDLTQLWPSMCFLK